MLENGFLYELAQAQMTREIFPKATLKYMPPTKFMTGNIFRGHIQDALFNMIGIWTSQGIQLLGMPTEAIHTPFMSDRYLSIENARYIFNNMKNIGDEVVFKENKCWIKLPFSWKRLNGKDFLQPWKKEFLPISSVPKTEEKAWTAFVPRERTIAILL